MVENAGGNKPPNPLSMIFQRKDEGITMNGPVISGKFAKGSNLRDNIPDLAMLISPVPIKLRRIGAKPLE